MGFFAVEKDTEIAMIFVDFPDHQFEKIGVVSLIFLFFEDIFF